MRLGKIRPMRKSTRIIAGSALLALGATGAAVTNAYADWSVTTKADAWFRCVSDCQAGGVGPVNPPYLVGPSTTTDEGFPTVGAWPRTVLIRCKTNTHHQAYHVTVQDKNWAGTWQVMKDSLSQPIDDSEFPVC
jgi:hypothetical protein